MRSQHQVTQELERLRDDLTALRSQSMRQHQFNHNATNGHDPEPPNLTNPRRVKKLTKFFGEDPPLMRLFLKNLGYEVMPQCETIYLHPKPYKILYQMSAQKYATLFEAERVGMIELPYLGEERLQKLGVPLGPRLRILQEAQISLCKDTTLCIVWCLPYKPSNAHHTPRLRIFKDFSIVLNFVQWIILAVFWNV